MNFFSKLIKPSKSSIIQKQDSAIFTSLQNEFQDEAYFIQDLPIFLQDETQLIQSMMIHPDIGIVLFTNFHHNYKDLQGVKASLAPKNESNVDISISSEKDFIKKRLLESSSSCHVDIHSVLICDALSEEEFENLDKSFSDAIPKAFSLFKNADNYKDKLTALKTSNKNIPIEKVKSLLFKELLIPDKQDSLNLEQETFVHSEITTNTLIKALPGSGKSSILVLKALYEKMKNPESELIIFARRACNVHFIQSLIFKHIENSSWGINPADIQVSSFNSIKKRSREKQKYDLIICDELDNSDMTSLKSLLNKDAVLIASSAYNINGIKIHNLNTSYRLSPAVCAACEGHKVEKIKESLSFQAGNVFMHATLIIGELLKEVSFEDISLVTFSKETSLQLQSQLNDYLNTQTYLVDEDDKEEGLLIYPLNQISCISSPYIIIVLDKDSSFDPIELISRASIKTFILSQSDSIYNIISNIKELNTEADA